MKRKQNRYSFVCHDTSSSSSPLSLLPLIVVFPSLLQQAYNAIAVSRQMKLMVLNSTTKTSRDNSCEREVPEEVREIVTNGDLFARLDVFLSKEDCDAGRFVVDGGGVRLAGVIHSGDAKSNNWLAYIFAKEFSH